MSTQEFHQLFTDQTNSLRNYALNLTKDSERAQDLYQETAFRAYSNQDKFRPGTNLKAWLMTIMKNIYINDYRKRRKQNTISDSTENLFYLNSSDVEIGNDGETNVFLGELMAMIDKLDDSLRVAFLMHYEGYKYQEIADALDLPLGTVKSRIFFARKELKAKIEKRYSNIFSLTSRVHKKIG